MRTARLLTVTYVLGVGVGTYPRPFVKDFEVLVKWMSNFWNQLVHRESYLYTIIKEWNKHN